MKGFDEVHSAFKRRPATARESIEVASDMRFERVK